MSRMQPLTFRAGARFDDDASRFWFETFVVHGDGQDRLTDGEKSDNRFPPAGTPSYTTLNAACGYRLTESAELAVRLENLTDEEYRIHGSGVNEPGRNLILTFLYHF